MPRYRVVAVLGSGSNSDTGSGFVGLSRERYEVEADNAALAYVEAHRHLESQGHSVAARAMGKHRDRPGQDDRPLGFTDDEIRTIADNGIEIEEDFPDGSGVQIEELYEVDSPVV